MALLSRTLCGTKDIQPHDMNRTINLRSQGLDGIRRQVRLLVQVVAHRQS